MKQMATKNNKEGTITAIKYQMVSLQTVESTSVDDLVTSLDLCVDWPENSNRLVTFGSELSKQEQEKTRQRLKALCASVSGITSAKAIIQPDFGERIESFYEEHDEG